MTIFLWVQKVLEVVGRSRWINIVLEVASFAGKSSTGMCRRLAVQVRNEAFSWVWPWYGRRKDKQLHVMPDHNFMSECILKFIFQIQVQQYPSISHIYTKKNCEATAPFGFYVLETIWPRFTSRYHAHRWNVDDLMAAALPHHVHSSDGVLGPF